MLVDPLGPHIEEDGRDRAGCIGSDLFSVGRQIAGGLGGDGAHVDNDRDAALHLLHYRFRHRSAFGFGEQQALASRSKDVEARHVLSEVPFDQIPHRG